MLNCYNIDTVDSKNTYIVNNWNCLQDTVQELIIISLVHSSTNV